MDRESIDNRMGWILSIEDYEKAQAGSDIYVTEYEICSEVRIPGALNYGDGALICGLLEEENELGLYTYLLHVKHIQREYNFETNSYSKKGYYFKDGLIGELLSLFSVFFQARFYLSATISGSLPPKSIKKRDRNNFHYKKPAQFLNQEMFSNQKRNWDDKEGLQKFLDILRTVDEQHHQSLMRAFYWYAEAIKQIGVDHQLFFIKMVSSVEALLAYVDVPNDDLPQKMENVLKKDLFNENQKGEIENWLENRKIRARFSRFLEQYSTGFFTGGNRRAKQCHIYKRDLEDYTKRIYAARSAYLHEGKPMYLSVDMRNEFARAWDIDPSQGRMSDRREFAINEKLPRVRWFERITNYCLKEFVKKHSDAGINT